MTGRDRPSLLLTFENEVQLEARYRAQLSEGRAFVEGDHQLKVGDGCEVVVLHPDSGASLELEAEVVAVEAEGVRVRFGLTPLVKNRLAKLAGKASPQARMHERLRNLNPTGRRKVAAGGDQTERTMLERLYGKEVWEALLSNPRITVPEVARLARIGNMPRPILELIVGNGAWVKVPQIRRALLTNPRLDAAMIQRILVHTPPAELKIMPKQTAYPLAVRSAAKRLLQSKSPT